MDLIYTILIGLVVGIIAKFFMPGKDPGGFIITVLIGIGGAVVAKLIGKVFNWYGSGESAGLIASIFGAIILLVIYRMITGRRTAV